MQDAGYFIPMVDKEKAMLDDIAFAFKTKWSALMVAVAGVLAPASWFVALYYYCRNPLGWAQGGGVVAFSGFSLLIAGLELGAIALAVTTWRRGSRNLLTAATFYVALLVLGVLLWINAVAWGWKL